MAGLPCIEFDHPDCYDDAGVAMVLGSTPAFEASPVSMAPSGRRYLYSCRYGGTLWKCVSEPASCGCLVRGWNGSVDSSESLAYRARTILPPGYCAMDPGGDCKNRIRAREIRIRAEVG